VSALEQRLADYLTLCRALGYRLVEHGRQLAGFVAFLDERGEDTVTVTAALAWASASGVSVGQTARRLSVVRRFASYLVAFDERTEVPPVDLLRAGRTRTTPYLYSPEEVAALLAAARRLQPALRGATIATAVGLMAATGLRTGETVALGRGDIDLSAWVLTIRDAKWRKTRQVPVHATVAAALEHYRQLRDATLPDANADAFFVSTTGTRLTVAELTRRFRGLLGELGIHAPPFRRPATALRLCRRRHNYDVRHTYATVGLMNATGWHEVKVISQRLGHASVGFTIDTYAHVLPAADSETAFTLARLILEESA
jgi:integrase/recombinase XerD